MFPANSVQILLQKEQIDSQNVLEALEFVKSIEYGAVNSFLGCTRSYENSNPEKRKVISLKYHAYEEMALKIMEEIVRDAIALYPEINHRIYVSHRIGQVDLGQISLLITIGSPHRKSGHKLTMHILNQIKQRVPIFKKILFEDKQSEWSEQSEAFWIDSKLCNH